MSPSLLVVQKARCKLSCPPELNLAIPAELHDHADGPESRLRARKGPPNLQQLNCMIMQLNQGASPSVQWASSDLTLATAAKLHDHAAGPGSHLPAPGGSPDFNFALPAELHDHAALPKVTRIRLKSKIHFGRSPSDSIL